MSSAREWSPAEWFEEAARRYVEGHQGCAWCGGSYRVFKSESADRLEYYCNACDFCVCQDRRNGTCHVTPGQAEPAEVSAAFA